MNPGKLRQYVIRLNGRMETRDQALTALRKQLEEAEAYWEKVAELHTLFASLRASWMLDEEQEANAEIVLSFLLTTDGTRVVTPEFVEDEDKEKPSRYQVVPLAQVTEGSCSHCSESFLRIEQRYPANATPAHEPGTTVRRLVCVNCRETQPWPVPPADASTPT